MFHLILFLLVYIFQLVCHLPYLYWNEVCNKEISSALIKSFYVFITLCWLHDTTVVSYRRALEKHKNIMMEFSVY